MDEYRDACQDAHAFRGNLTMHHRAVFTLSRELASPALVGVVRPSLAALVVLLSLLTANQASAGLMFSSQTLIDGDSAGETISQAYGDPIWQADRNDPVTDSAQQAFPSGAGTSSCAGLRLIAWPALLPPGRQLPILEPFALLARNNFLLFLPGHVFQRLRPPRAS